MKLLPPSILSIGLSMGLNMVTGSSLLGAVPSEMNAFLGQYCVGCHGPTQQKGDFRVDELRMSENSADAASWELVLDNLHLGEMPPRKHSPQPSMEEVEPITRWIEAELVRAKRALQGQTGEVVMRRLNRVEYENTIRDLFGIEGDFAAGFPEDTLDHGFDNNGAALMLSAAQMQEYLDAAEFVLARATAPKQQPKTEKTAFTLHDMNKQAWESYRQQLERRLKDFDSLTPKEQQRTRDLQAQSEANPHAGARFPVWENGSLRQPTPEDGPGVDAVLAIRAYNASTPSTGNFQPVRIPGWYRFAITPYAVANDGKPVRLKITYGSFKPGTPPKTAGILPLTSDTPEEHTFDLYLEPGDRVKFEMLDGTNWAASEKMLELTGPFIAVREASLEGPIYETWPPPGHRVIYGDHDPHQPTPESVSEIVAHFAPTLFRRAVPKETVEKYTAFYQELAETLPPAEALQTTLATMMVAPQFLYRIEPPQSLDSYALASRLSSFLWRSTPDDALLAQAATGRLQEPEVLRAEVDRMLADPKADRFLHDFTGQWLRVNDVGAMRPDMNLYPEYDEELENAMREETVGFVREMFMHDLPFSQFIDSDWTILNERLAKHYGIPGVEGPGFRRVALDKSQTVRGGLLTHASIHAVTSNGTTTSPIIRGVWMLENFLGTPPPPPPPDVPLIEPDIRGATNIRDQLVKHRDIPQCASCHARIDPLGLALENFDVIGGWRESYRALAESPGKAKPTIKEGPPVDPSAVVEGAGSFESFEEFRAMLLAREDLVATNVAQKLATFALGRSLDFADRDDITALVQSTRSQNGGLRTMVHALVQNPIFHKP